MGASNSDLFISVIPNRKPGTNDQQKAPATEVDPRTRRSTRGVSTMASSVIGDRGKKRLADSPHPVPASTSPSTATSGPLPAPPGSAANTSAATPVSIPDPRIYPEATTIHHYTHCAHTSPPATRPLNVQPTLVHPSPSGAAPMSTLRGRCYSCDVAHRRGRESGVLEKYHRATNALHWRLLAARQALQSADTNSHVDEDGINDMVAELDSLVARREADVHPIWKGFAARWGPGTVGVQKGLRAGGRMNVEWERPEKR